MQIGKSSFASTLSSYYSGLGDLVSAGKALSIGTETAQANILGQPMNVPDMTTALGLAKILYGVGVPGYSFVTPNGAGISSDGTITKVYGYSDFTDFENDNNVLEDGQLPDYFDPHIQFQLTISSASTFDLYEGNLADNLSIATGISVDQLVTDNPILGGSQYDSVTNTSYLLPSQTVTVAPALTSIPQHLALQPLILWS